MVYFQSAFERPVGCLAQRESIALTRRGSQVRNLQHPPPKYGQIKRSNSDRGRIAKWPNAADCKSAPSGSVVQIHLHPPLCLLGCSQAVRQETLTLSYAGSIPATPTSLKRLLRIVEVFLFF